MNITAGGTFTSGFPSLDEVRGNGSLLSDGVYSTHDGEIRSVPSVEFTCNGRITKFTFIALPGVGDQHTEFVVPGQGPGVGNSDPQRISTEGATQSFGEFGYELSVPGQGMMVQAGDTLEIYHYWHVNSRLRILHQVGDEELDICWRWRDEDSSNDRCVTDYDYSLVAIETGK